MDKISIDQVVRTLIRNRKLSLGLPVPMIRADVPIGYILNPKNSNECIAVEAHFELLKQARKYLRESPYAEVANWLTKNGLPISHNGLHKLMIARPPFTDDERINSTDRASSQVQETSGKTEE